MNKIKYLYMFFRHPLLFFKLTLKYNTFIRGNTDIRHINRLHLGKGITFGYDTRINFYGNDDIYIGDNCFFCHRDSILVGGKITIGNSVMIASDVCIVSENHGIDPFSEKSYMTQDLEFKNINIGSGTWIGEKVIILPGTSIGEKCVIGAGSVITKDIPDMCIAAGNPAKIIKRFDIETNVWKRVE